MGDGGEDNDGAGPVGGENDAMEDSDDEVVPNDKLPSVPSANEPEDDDDNTASNLVAPASTAQPASVPARRPTPLLPSQPATSTAHISSSPAIAQGSVSGTINNTNNNDDINNGDWGFGDSVDPSASLGNATTTDNNTTTGKAPNGKASGKRKPASTEPTSAADAVAKAPTAAASKGKAKSAPVTRAAKPKGAVANNKATGVATAEAGTAKVTKQRIVPTRRTGRGTNVTAA